MIGKSRPHIANTLRLLKLPDEVQDYLRDGKLTAGHARALVTLDDPEAAARKIVEAGLNVRDVEALGAGRHRAQDSGGAARKPSKDADTRALEKSLSDRSASTVAIDHKADGGEVTRRATDARAARRHRPAAEGIDGRAAAFAARLGIGSRGWRNGGQNGPRSRGRARETPMTDHWSGVRLEAGQRNAPPWL